MCLVALKTGRAILCYSYPHVVLTTSTPWVVVELTPSLTGLPILDIHPGWGAFADILFLLPLVTVIIAANNI